MTAGPKITAQTVELMNEIVPALMDELAERGFKSTETMSPASIIAVPEESAIAMVATLLAELPQIQVIDVAFNALIQLAMVHVTLNEKGI